MAKEASNYIKEEVWENSMGGFVQMFSLQSEFASEWHLFKSSEEVTRKLELNISKIHFPYWMNSVQMDGTLEATFCSIDWEKKKLSASKSVDLDGNEDTFPKSV